LFLISDFIKYDDRESFFVYRFHGDFLNANVIFGDQGLDAESSAAEDEVSYLNDELTQTLFIEFALFFLDVVFEGGK
jgi:hypothetical protein